MLDCQSKEKILGVPRQAQIWMLPGDYCPATVLASSLDIKNKGAPPAASNRNLKFYCLDNLQGWWFQARLLCNGVQLHDGRLF